jgi:hypothetical protein
MVQRRIPRRAHSDARIVALAAAVATGLRQPRRKARGGEAREHNLRRQRPDGSRGRVTSCVRKVRQTVGRRVGMALAGMRRCGGSEGWPERLIERPREALPLSPSKPRAVEISARPTPDRLTPCTLDAHRRRLQARACRECPLTFGMAEASARDVKPVAQRASAPHEIAPRRAAGRASGTGVHRGHDRARERRARDQRSQGAVARRRPALFGQGSSSAARSMSPVIWSSGTATIST